MKKFITIILIGLILVGCSNKKTDNVESTTISQSKNSIEKSESKENTTLSEKIERAKIKYPNLVSNEIKNSKIYSDIIKDGNAVITVNWEIVTDFEVITSFFDKVNKGEEATLNFYSLDNIVNLWAYKSSYIFDGEKIIEQITGTSLPESIDYESATFNDLVWNENYSEYSVFKMELSKFGDILIDSESSSDKIVLQCLNDRDLYRNFDENDFAIKKYVNNLSFAVVTGVDFNNPTELFKDRAIMPTCDNIISYEANDNYQTTFWSVYPESKMPFDDFYNLMSNYFEIDKLNMYNIMKPYMDKNNFILYEGGYGGAYPRIIVEDVINNIDHLKIYIRLDDVLGGFTDDTRKVLTVKLCDDGTFKYKSLITEKATPILLNETFTNSYNKIVDKVIVSK